MNKIENSRYIWFSELFEYESWADEPEPDVVKIIQISDNKDLIR